MQNAHYVAKALVWSSEDINSYDIEFDTENELLHNEELQKENFLQAFNLGLFTDLTCAII